MSRPKRPGSRPPSPRPSRPRRPRRPSRKPNRPPRRSRHSPPAAVAVVLTTTRGRSAVVSRRPRPGKASRDNPLPAFPTTTPAQMRGRRR
ncbi:hypothetical protein C1H66_13630 [Halomonas heilongjiangensis]|uniref:Uncharacterized protein n=1 Tax=Halomonas heilongjiangensis TaxID=1387883 RepID=A0A2N7TKP1_9GAMM|nr:hypothetical protein C1H66_13630 [Halomonas heilongjiangensis]